MAYEEQITAFRTWATSLGCPPSDLPSDDALKSVFKTGHGNLFEQLQARIQPRHVVEKFREDLFNAQMAKYKDKVVPMSERSSLTEPMQIYLKMKDLAKEEEKAKQLLDEQRKEYAELAKSIKAKNIQIISAKHKNTQLEAKCNILKLKLESLDKTLEKEKEIKAQILATMPVRLTTKNSSETLAMKAVEQAHKELTNFYSICDANGNNAQKLAEAKAQLWTRMRELFADVPNVLIFNAIMKIKDEQLHHIMQLNKSSNSALTKAPFNNFDVKLLKTKADLLGLAAQYLSAKNEVKQLEDRFSVVYSSFVDDLKNKVFSFNGINENDKCEVEAAEEIISNYLLQYNMRTFYQAQNDYLTEQIEQLRLELDAGAKQLENHDLLLGSVKQMYSEINSSVKRIQHDVAQMSQIKEKIIYSKNLMKNLLDDMQTASHNQNAKSQLLSTKLKVSNMSMLGMESFNMANDTVFSSTRLEVDANTSVMQRSFENTTMMPGLNSVLSKGPGSALPCHLIELNTFLETAIEAFSCVPQSCAFLLSANPLIVESLELTSIIQLAPGHLLTPHGALQEVSQRILWASAIAEHSSELKLNLEPIIVDPHSLKQRAKRQHEEVVRLLDSIDHIGKRTQHQLQKAQRIYEFILDNPLSRYVPPKKLVNNATFAQYESEFNLYYRMATVGPSIRAKK